MINAMPLPVITNVIRAAVEGTLGDGKQWVNVYNFRKTGGLTNAGAIAILDPLLTHVYTVAHSGGGQSWLQIATSLASLDQIVYTPLDGSSASTTIAKGNAATGTGDQLPNQVALTTTLYTALRGRAHRGRVRWGGFRESGNVATGEPDSTMVAGIQAQYTGLIADLVASGVSLVVASYKFATAEDVVTALTRSRWSTLRKRQLRQV